MDEQPASRLRPRFRWWRWLAALVVVAAGVVVAAWLVEEGRARDRRDRLRAVVPELEAAVAAHLECLLPPPGEPGTPCPYQDWAAGEDVHALARSCAVALDGVAAALLRRVPAGDGELLYDLEREAGDILHRADRETVAAACAQVNAIRATVDELRRRAGLGPGPRVECVETIAELDPPSLDRERYAGLFDAVTLAEPWVRSEGDNLYVGGRYERLGDGGMTGGEGIARNAGGTWSRVERAGDVERMRWQDDGPWAIARTEARKAPWQVALHRDGAWSDRVELPRITDVAAMRSTGDGRVLVGWRSDDALVVLRLDAEAQRILETIELGVKTSRIPELAVTTAGDVTAIWKLDDGDADVIHLAAGASVPRRTTEAATGAVFDLCLDGRDVFLRFGARLLHSGDGGATLTELPGFGSLEWHHLVCGPGWLAGLDGAGDSYVVCRDGACRRSPLTTRDFSRFALSRAGDAVRILAQAHGVAVLWEDPAATGTPRLRGVWRVDDQHTLVQIEGTWFHTSPADLGAY